MTYILGPIVALDNSKEYWKILIKDEISSFDGEKGFFPLCKWRTKSCLNINTLTFCFDNDSDTTSSDSNFYKDFLSMPFIFIARTSGRIWWRTSNHEIWWSMYWHGWINGENFISRWSPIRLCIWIENKQGCHYYKLLVAHAESDVF